MGDPDFNITEIPSDMVMLPPSFAQKLKKAIYDDQTFDPSHYGGR